MSQKVKTEPTRRDNNQGYFQRETFRTSRQLDYFSVKELVTQTGHECEEWPLVILKELVDNALDACEDAGVAPSLHVVADSTGITVADNGPGIPESTIEGVVDFTVRTSSREAYVAPDRGAQGNALKTLLAIPFVADHRAGRLIVTAAGCQHTLQCRVDPISQRVEIQHDRQSVPSQGGTGVRLEWGELDDPETWPFDPDANVTSMHRGRNTSLMSRAQELLKCFGAFNPHLSLEVDWFGDFWTVQATNPAWSKWKPSNPTSPHWYGLGDLERLVAACVTADRERKCDRTINEFLASFDGLTGSGKRKQVLNATGLTRVKLSELATEDGLRQDVVQRLLDAMQATTREVKPQRLGTLGREHLTARLLEQGCVEDSIQYTKVARVDQGMPFVLESAFGWKGEGVADCRQLYVGANWSAAIKNPIRSFGSTGEGLEALLRELRLGATEPVVFVLHLAHPRVEYTDRGKSAIVINAKENC